MFAMYLNDDLHERIHINISEIKTCFFFQECLEFVLDIKKRLVPY